jgi:hypothetical protein
MRFLLSTQFMPLLLELPQDLTDVPDEVKNTTIPSFTCQDSKNVVSKLHYRFAPKSIGTGS